MSPVSNHRLLLVGDNDQVRRLIVSVLQREGFAVESAIDAAEVRHFLDTQPVDLIPLDLHMPGPADGEDLLFLLRDRGGNAAPVIVVSGWVDDEVVLNRPDCVQAVVKKPIDITNWSASSATTYPPTDPLSQAGRCAGGPAAGTPAPPFPNSSGWPSGNPRSAASRVPHPSWAGVLPGQRPARRQCAAPPHPAPPPPNPGPPARTGLGPAGCSCPPGIRPAAGLRPGRNPRSRTRR
ncbi:MAG: response regulator [Candidatus Handelsmanbacteria bacterium]|nr:response regulator [Candidatus Handelsmanbacteria bacterium]